MPCGKKKKKKVYLQHYSPFLMMANQPAPLPLISGLLIALPCFLYKDNPSSLYRVFWISGPEGCVLAWWSSPKKPAGSGFLQARGSSRLHFDHNSCCHCRLWGLSGKRRECTWALCFSGVYFSPLKFLDISAHFRSIAVWEAGCANG